MYKLGDSVVHFHRLLDPVSIRFSHVNLNVLFSVFFSVFKKISWLFFVFKQAFKMYAEVNVKVFRFLNRS